MVKADLELVKEFLKDQKIDALNTRAFKKQNGSYEITVGSINKSTSDHEFKDHQFKVTYGEFGTYLEEAV
jgi:hypothetical protein